MTLKRVLLTASVIAIAFTGFSQEAQQKAGKKLKVNFASYNSLNLLNGYDAVHAGFQTVNGVSLNNSFIGAGIGVDWYGSRSAPLFGEFRQQFKIGKLTFFGYGDLGYNIAWTDRASGNQFSNMLVSQYGGVYFDIGAGYLIPFRKRNAMILSAGYSVKKVSEKYAYSIWAWRPTPDELSYETLSYKYQRLSIKIGWRF